MGNNFERGSLYQENTKHFKLFTEHKGKGWCIRGTPTMAAISPHVSPSRGAGVPSSGASWQAGRRCRCSPPCGCQAAPTCRPPPPPARPPPSPPSHSHCLSASRSQATQGQAWNPSPPFPPAAGGVWQFFQRKSTPPPCWCQDHFQHSCCRDPKNNIFIFYLVKRDRRNLDS